MPTQHEVRKRIASSADDVRWEYLNKLHKRTKRDTLVYAVAFSSRRALQVPGYHLSINNEDIQGYMSSLHGLKGDRLDLILHSPGGSLETASQIIRYLRKKYAHIRAIVPQNAMSAATIIATACDEIVMGKHSAIGPIDPQIQMANSSAYIPAQAIVDEFDEARQEILANPTSANVWAAKLMSIPPGFVKHCRNVVLAAKLEVQTNLAANMFKGSADGEQKAHDIAEWLGSNEQQKIHGRPISADEAEARGLRVQRLESDQDFQEAVLSVYHATMATFESTSCIKIIENHMKKGTYYLFSAPTKP